MKDANDEGLVGPKSFPIIFNREDFIICKFFVLMCAQANLARRRSGGRRLVVEEPFGNFSSIHSSYLWMEKLVSDGLMTLIILFRKL